MTVTVEATPATLRVAMFQSAFPVASETFVIRQLTGLLDRGHDVRVFAEWDPGAEKRIFGEDAADPAAPHPEVLSHGLLDRTTYVRTPVEGSYWELPVRPLRGRTWIPVEERYVSNVRRAARGQPGFLVGSTRSPRLAAQTITRRAYGYQADSLSALHRLARLAPERPTFDVLHMHFLWTARNFRFVRDLWRAPMVVSVHGGTELEPAEGRDRAVYEEVLATADLVTVNSVETRTRVERAGCAPEKIRVLPMGVPLDEFPFQARNWRRGEPLRLLSVARLVEVKGLEYAIKAVAQLRARLPEVRLSIVGEGPLREQLRALISRVGVDDLVTLEGAATTAEVRRHMADAHLFLLASITTDRGVREGQGLVLQEAQASGLPVVATDHGPFRESTRSAVLVPERDAGAIADAIEGLAARPGDWATIGAHGREHVERIYDADRLMSDLLATYAEAIAGYRS